MLFSPALGFEVLSLGLTGPCRIHFGPFWSIPFEPAYAESTILVREVPGIGRRLQRDQLQPEAGHHQRRKLYGGRHRPDADELHRLGLAGGTTYCYVVTASNLGGESAGSAETSAITAPSAPGSLVATAGNGQVVLSWAASAGAGSYTIRRSTTSGSG